MKKLIMLLSATILSFGLVACGTPNTKTTTPPATEATTEDETATEDDTTAEGEAVAEDDTTTEGETVTE